MVNFITLNRVSVSVVERRGVLLGGKKRKL